MQTPKAILIDIDGTLTDGALSITEDGEKLFKRFHTRDVRAIRELILNGFEVYLVSADDWEGHKHFADKVGADFLWAKDKSVLKQVIGKPFIAVGDDSWDIPMLKDAALKFCPADAFYKVMQVKGIEILKTDGGKGCIAELVNILLSEIPSFIEGRTVENSPLQFDEIQQETIIPAEKIKQVLGK